MKLTKRNLQRLIKEAMGSDAWIVMMGNPGGHQNLWPNTPNPQVLSRPAAKQVVDSLNRKSHGHGHHQEIWRVVPLRQALTLVQPGSDADIALSSIDSANMQEAIDTHLRKNKSEKSYMGSRAPSSLSRSIKKSYNKSQRKYDKRLAKDELEKYSQDDPDSPDYWNIYYDDYDSGAPEDF